MNDRLSDEENDLITVCQQYRDTSNRLILETLLLGDVTPGTLKNFGRCVAYQTEYTRSYSP